jgi:DNA polymerase-3 subunit delta
MAAALTPERLAAALTAAPPAPVYYLAGAEALLKDQATDLIVDATLDPGVRDFNLDLLSAATLEPDQLEAACSTLPMMADRRVVIVSGVEAWKRKVKGRKIAADYLARPTPDTVLILVQGDDKDADADLARHAVLVDCGAPVGDALDRWLDQQLDAAGVTLTADAREHLLRATHGAPGFLAAEVAKLAGLAGGEPLDRDTVGDLVGIRHGETIYDWRDAVLRDDVAAASTMLPRLLDQSGVSGVQLVFTLGASLIVLQWARAVARRRDLRGRPLINAVKQCCFDTRPLVGSYGPFADLIGGVVAEWPMRRVAVAVRAALAADVALKSTTISTEEGILTDLVLTLAASRIRKAA